MAMVSSSDFLRAPERPTAIATLNRQRHLTPSCGGLAPTAERTVGPARISLESLTPRPGIREHPDPELENNICQQRKSASHSIASPANARRDPGTSNDCQVRRPVVLQASRGSAITPLPS